MTPEELLAVLDALPGVEVDTHWPVPEGEFDPLKVFVALRVDGEPCGDHSFEIWIQGSESDGQGTTERGRAAETDAV
jgi:hypothetical protein